MRHPFESLAPDRRKRFFWLSLAVSLFLMVLLNMVGAPMNTSQSPYGIVSYELAGSLSQAQAMLASWDQQAQLRAAFSLGLDYLFMPAYAIAISLACVSAADVLRQRNWPLVSLGALLAWGQWLAASLDAVENLALAVMLFGTPRAPWPELAWGCATLKFALILAGIFYALLGLAAARFARPMPRA